MVQCEMCGAETSAPSTITVEGATLQVCSNCTDFGTEVSTEDSSSSSTKYSTGSSGGTGGTSTAGGSNRSRSSSSSGSGTTGGSRGSDMFDELDELAPDYDDRIRRGREERGLSQEDLAHELNEKASLIRKLERGETLPSDDVQGKLERFLEVSLTGGAETPDDEEWESEGATEGYTLGDVVERKD